MKLTVLGLTVLGLFVGSWLNSSALAADQAFAPFAALDGSQLDAAAFAESLEGKEAPIPDSAAKTGPASVVWTTKTKPEFRGVKYGEGRSAGTRHLRIGFTKALPVGSVLVRGGGKLSYLKPNAEYPGKLDDESQWQPAERLVNGVVTHDEVDNEGYAVWVLPANTTTRALRFSHTPQPGDRESAGWIGGLWILPQRLGNVAPQALAQSVARDDASAKLVDESHNKTWSTWQNSEQGALQRVSPEHPEYITLTWTKPVTLDALCLLWNGFADFEIEAFTGKDDENVREASNERWQRVGGKTGMDSLYPLALGPHWVPLDKSTTTRAIRLRITSGAKSGHSHLNDKVKEGRRVWLGEVMALTTLDRGTSLASLVLPKVTEEPAADPDQVHAAASRRRHARDRRPTRPAHQEPRQRNAVPRGREHRVVGRQ